MNQQVIVVNVTDTTVRDALIEAETSSKHKSMILSSVSHELRTPLNGSINFIEQALNDSTVPSSIKQKWLTPAIRSNYLLLSLVDDILDFSQIQTGKLRLSFESKNIVKTAQECIELIELQAARKNLELKLENNLPKGSEMFNTDHNRLKQVIINLLSNAVKFTFEGQIVLTLDRIPPSQMLHSYCKGIRVSCKDTGIGISPDSQNKLYLEIEKIDSKIRAQINPTGSSLGLVIANSIVQSLSTCTAKLKQKPESLEFESIENQGTTFHFNIYDQEESKRDSQLMLEDNEMECSLERGIKAQSVEELSREILWKGLRSSDYSKQKQEYTSRRKFRLSSRVNSIIHSPKPGRSAFSLMISTVCTCPRILIVDDDIFNLMALNQLLSKLGLGCHWAYNGKQAIEKIMLRQEKPCPSPYCQQYKVVFLDCNMPIMDGFETARVLRTMIKNEEIADLKIICCTAFTQQADEDKAKEAGMNEFCTKPISMQTVKEKLMNVGFFDDC